MPGRTLLLHPPREQHIRIQLERQVDSIRHLRKHLRILTSAENPFAQTQPVKVPAFWVGHSASNHAWPSNAAWLGIPMFVSNTTNTVLNKNFTAPFTDYLRQMLALLDNEGLGGRGICKFYDEPSMAAPTLNAVSRVAAFLKSIAPTLSLRISGGVLTAQLAPFFDVWDVHAAYVGPQSDYVSAAAET